MLEMLIVIYTLWTPFLAYNLPIQSCPRLFSIRPQELLRIQFESIQEEGGVSGSSVWSQEL